MPHNPGDRPPTGKPPTPGGKTPSTQDGKTPHSQGETIPTRGEKREPRLPHEHDESSESQAPEQPSQAEVGEQAHEDIERGLVDTGRAPVSNRVYKDRLKGDEPPPERES